MRRTDVRYLRKELEEYQRLQASLPACPCWRTAALEKKLQAQAERLAEQLWEITKLIAAIDNAELRLIFELRYFRGCTWQEVAEELPVRITPSAARMKHDRYLQKIKKQAV